MDKDYVSDYVKAVFTAVDMDELTRENQNKSDFEIESDGFFPVSVFLGIETDVAKAVGSESKNQQISHKLLFEVVNNALMNAR